jgi:hypothetical protein
MAIALLMCLPVFASAETIPDGNAWEMGGWRRVVPESLKLWTDYNPFNSTGGGSLPAGTASIAGSVWLDVNLDGAYDKKKDSPIIGARVFLYSGTPDLTAAPLAIASTDKSGFYSFDKLPAGEYALKLYFPSSTDGVNTLGTVDDRFGVLQPASAGTLVDDQDLVLGITLDDGSTATGYDFGEVYAPTTKRLFLNPEPGTVTALVGVVLCGGLAWLRRRKKTG